ncbi:MAG: thioredoxin family protein [Planctomycetota bacterium]|nr:thioredoxin family protein [Planctomycetota bacterium]
MDGSFLSDRAVVAASRGFVCARLLTYESATEATLLGSLFQGRSGELENTTFALLAPDGKTPLARTGRSPSFAYGHGSEAVGRMAEAMEMIRKRYPGKRAATAGAPLPLLPDVRRGVNVAACDGLPLVIVIGRDEAHRRALEANLAPLAWAEGNQGAFLYASTHELKDLEGLAEVKRTAGYAVIAPGTYGADGKGLVQVPADATAKTIQAALNRARGAFAAPEKSQGDHVRDGKRAGVHWDTEIPVTDPGIPPAGKRGPPPGR